MKIIYQEPLMTSRERDDALLGAVEDHYEGDSTDELVEDRQRLTSHQKWKGSDDQQHSAAGLSDWGRIFENLLWPDLNL